MDCIEVESREDAVNERARGGRRRFPFHSERNETFDKPPPASSHETFHARRLAASRTIGCTRFETAALGKSKNDATGGFYAGPYASLSSMKMPHAFFSAEQHGDAIVLPPLLLPLPVHANLLPRQCRGKKGNKEQTRTQITSRSSATGCLSRQMPVSSRALC